QIREMFQRELKVLAQLEHPNVVRVLDAGRIGERWFIALEYVHGVSLRTLLELARKQRRGLSVAMALTIADPVLRALQHAHTREDRTGKPLGIVHRDVTPGNVLISTLGVVKLVDFG